MGLHWCCLRLAHWSQEHPPAKRLWLILLQYLMYRGDPEPIWNLQFLKVCLYSLVFPLIKDPGEGHADHSKSESSNWVWGLEKAKGWRDIINVRANVTRMQWEEIWEMVVAHDSQSTWLICHSSYGIFLAANTYGRRQRINPEQS